MKECTSTYGKRVFRSLLFGDYNLLTGSNGAQIFRNIAVNPYLDCNCMLLFMPIVSAFGHTLANSVTKQCEDIMTWQGSSMA